MRREFAWGDAALSEFDAACENWARNAPARGVAFLEAVDTLVLSLRQFPLQGRVLDVGLPFEVRRVRLRAFYYLLSYTVYPSVDLNSGEALDVIYVLACRHEKQAEPPWSARDPFRLS